MPTITEIEEIEKLIDLFKERNVKFYHACQYKDFKTYLEIGGIPSRNLMQERCLPYTPFCTDKSDQEKCVWTMVFGNLNDFGFAFARGKKSENTAPTPNPYGPILMKFNPEVFREAVDIAICLTSAGSNDFNRDHDALPNVATVNRIFKHEDIEDAPENEKHYIAYSAILKERFNNDDATTPEVSCIVKNELFSFDQLDEIIVDPYTINNQSLIMKVRDLKKENGLIGDIQKRKYQWHEKRFEMKQELVNLLLKDYLLSKDCVTIPQIIKNNDNSKDLKDWAERIKRGNMEYMYDRFVNYLRRGTIIELYKEGEKLVELSLDN